MKHDFDHIVHSAIGWAAVEFYELKELRKEIGRIENESIKTLPSYKKLPWYKKAMKGKYASERAKFRVALRIMRYLGNAERRALQFEKVAGKKLGELVQELTALKDTDLVDAIESFRKIAQDLKIEMSTLLELNDRYEGKLKKEVDKAKAQMLVMEELNGENPDKAQEIHASFLELLRSIEDMIEKDERWIGLLQESLRQVNIQFHYLPPKVQQRYVDDPDTIRSGQRTVALSRRGLITTAVAVGTVGWSSLSLANTRAKIVKELNRVFNSPEIRTLNEFTDLYLKLTLAKKRNIPISIAYPGSGSDLKPLLIGFRILHETNMKRVNFVYTEIGDEKVAWYPKQEELCGSIERVIEELIDVRLISTSKKRLEDHGSITSDGKAYQKVDIIYTLQVQTAKGTKTMVLTIEYNRAETRRELSREEKAYFGEVFMGKVRGNYWPKKDKIKRGVWYPKYARDKVFANADIIISHKCGDYHLLQFDYLRAIWKSGVAKQRAILDEYIHDNYALEEPLHVSPSAVKTYNVKVVGIDGPYGYTAGRDKVGIVLLTPT